MKKIILIFVFLGLLISCERVDFGEDMNVNQNAASTGDASALLAGAIQKASSNYYGPSHIVPALYTQYQAEVTYTDNMLYTRGDKSYSPFYVQLLSNLNIVKELTSGTPSAATLSYGYPANQKAVAMILMAYTYKRVSDAWGDIPYSQNFDPINYPNPVLDPQEDLYRGEIQNLKDAVAMIDVSQSGPSGDILLNGDMDKWKKFGNSMILAYCIQMSKKYPTASGFAATEFNTALANGVIENVSDDVYYTFYNATFKNPYKKLRASDYAITKEFTDALQGNTAAGTLNPTSNHSPDYRLFIYSTGGMSGVGQPYGYAVNTAGSGAAIKPADSDSDLPLMTASYTYLNRAEAANLGWTSENVSNMLRSGIEKSWESLNDHYGNPGITGFAAAYATARITDAGTTSFAQVIAEEKWSSLFLQPFEGWAEQRKSGFPALVPATDARNSGVIPRRYEYPASESGGNVDNYNAAVARLVPATDVNESKVWWDQ